MSARRMLGLTLLLVAACEDPPVDALRPEGSALPPSGAITGTVQYTGPRPVCAAGAGGALEPIGRVVLTLFAFDDPPPPEGTARSALNLLTIPGRDLFQAPDDCLPADPGPDDLRVVVGRSAAFAWPDIFLGNSYQIRGFYDADADFVPFFGESSQPTAGDVGGGAVDLRTGDYVEIAFDPPAARPDGQVRSGIAVNLGAVVWTERPVFTYQDPTASVASATTFPATADPLQFEQMIYDAAGLTLSLVAADDQGFVDAAAGLAVRFDPASPGYAWFLEPVDVDGDGMDDPHPVLPGVPWSTPLISLTRIPTAGEGALGVPPVTLVGSVRPSLPASGKRVVRPNLDVLVAPVALVELIPGDLACRVPYVPPGNFRETYEAGARDCQELPTGAYAVTVLQGVAGGTGFTMADPPAASDTGLVIDGGSLATQSWTVPNPLGVPMGGVPSVPGQLQVFYVHDTAPEDGVGQDAPGCSMAFSPAEMNVAPIEYTAVPDRCCEAVRPLCDVPLCAAFPAPGRPDLSVRADATASVPATCVPFALPRSCCEPAAD